MYVHSTVAMRNIVPVVQNTWAKELATAENIAYYSELKDVIYSTTDIGVPNTERGRCVCIYV